MGACFYLGLFWADLHPVVPFLLMGIGVDDMFVIVQCLENLVRGKSEDILVWLVINAMLFRLKGERKRRLPIRQRIALAMKHAGSNVKRKKKPG